MRIELTLKRVIDVVGALIGLVSGTPIFVLAAIAVKLESKGPVIFRHCRVGKDGKPFMLYKIRSMVNGAERFPYNPLGKDPKDPRVTRVGKFIRRASIDEIPQFINVLKGEMSLVGPRSFSPHDAHMLPEGYWDTINKFKPGITGLCQVNGRGNTCFDKRVNLDLEYAKNWTLRMDIKILVKTIRVVISREGAY